MAIAERIMLILERLLEVILFVLLLMMATLVFSNVIARYVFASSITWAAETARYAFIWATFLGAALGVRRGAHIGIDLLTTRFGPQVQRVLAVIANLLIIGFLYIWFTQGFRLVEVNTKFLGPASGIPLAAVYAVGPVSAALMAIFTLMNITKLFFPKGTA